MAQASDFRIERKQVVFPLLNAGFQPRVSDTKSSADWMPTDKLTEPSRIKLKTLTRQAVPLISYMYIQKHNQWKNICYVKLTDQLLYKTSYPKHYNGIIMSAMGSQIIHISNVCSTVCSDADQRKHQSSMSLAFVRGRVLVDSPHKWPVTWKMFPFNDLIMKCTKYKRRVAIHSTKHQKDN